MTRNPRNWRRYWHSYLGHMAQGFVIGLLVPCPFNLVLLWESYLFYQRIEYERLRDKRDAVERGAPVVDDWPSRDTADLMAGMWLGNFVQNVAMLLMALWWLT